MTWSFARAAIAALALVLVSLSPPPALAENYPTKPITIVVPLGAGTGMDIVVRLYADKLAQVLGKAVACPPPADIANVVARMKMPTIRMNVPSPPPGILWQRPRERNGGLAHHLRPVVFHLTLALSRDFRPKIGDFCQVGTGL
jgi:hypothetical protein